MSWNPNAATNCVSGLEWAPTRQVDRMVTGVAGSSYSWVVESTVAENVDRLYTYSSVAVPSAFDVIDVYDVANLAPAVEQVDSYSYAADAIAARFVRPLGGYFFTGTSRTGSINQTLANTFQTGDWVSWHTLLSAAPTAGEYRGRVGDSSIVSFDESVPILNRQFIGLTAFPSLLDPVGLDYASSFSQWAFHVNGLTTNTSGRRILGLTVSCVCQRLVDPRARSSEFDQPYRIRPALLMGSRNVFGQAQIMPSTPQVVSYTWFQNPVTGLAWTGAELDAFGSSPKTNAVAWLMSRPDDPAVRQHTAGAIYTASASVTHVAETRVAQAVRSSPQQVVGWNKWDVTAIGGGAWAKDDFETYLFNDRINVQQAVDWRPTLSTEGLSVRALGDGVGASNGVYEVGAQFVGQVPRSVGAFTGFGPAVVMQEPLADGDALSVDSQPYAVVQDRFGLGVVRDPGQEFVGQIVDLATTDKPDVLRLVARSENDQVPQCDLLATVVDTGNVLEATADPITPDMLDYPGRWQTFEVPLVENAWDFTSLGHFVVVEAVGNGVGWQVLAMTDGTNELGATDGGIDPSETGFGGITLQAIGGDPFVFRPDGDAPIVIGRKPGTPVPVDLTYDPMHQFGPCFRFEFDGDPTDDCSALGLYEVQRRTVTNVGNTIDWQTVFVLDVDGTEPTYVVRDWEAPRNATSEYRVRLVGATGLSSDWSAPLDEDATDDVCGYRFTSNVAPQLNVLLDDIGARQYQFVEKVLYYQFEDRDGQVPARGLTDLLDRFTVDVLLAGNRATAPTEVAAAVGGPGRRVFDAVTIIGGNKRDEDGVLYRLPYVAVLDQDGQRWFASLETPTGIRREPAGQYRATVEVVEVTRTAAPLVITDYVPEGS